jgi:sphingomyelin phosphodiesterase
MGKCDLPLRTLQNFVDHLYEKIKPDFIIWTGDNPSHTEYKIENQDEAINITRIFSNMLIEKNQEYNLTIPVYPVLGNHEKFPIDQFFPFDTNTENPLLIKIASSWKNFLIEEAYNSFIKYGYYTQKHLNTNLRIICYNSLLIDILNFYLLKSTNDPNGQLIWLENTLKKAEKDNEIVYLIGHIPIADVTFNSESSKRYQILLDRYSNIIRGNFAGHTHFDEVKVMRSYYKSEETTGIIYIAPSLTT